MFLFRQLQSTPVISILDITTFSINIGPKTVAIAEISLRYKHNLVIRMLESTVLPARFEGFRV